MITIKVLGMGCKKCENLELKVKDLVSKYAIDARIEKVTDLQQIMQYKVLSTPALVINEQVKSSGLIPKDEEIINWMRGAE